MGHPSSHIFLCRWYNLIGLENSGSISGSIFYSSPAGLQLCRPPHHRRSLFPGIFTGYLHSSSRASFRVFHGVPARLFSRFFPGIFTGYLHSSFRTSSRAPHRRPCAALSALLPAHFTRAPARLFPRFFPRISSSCPRGSFRASHQSTCTALFAFLPAHFIKLPARLLSHKNIPLRNDVQRIPRSGRRPPLDGHDNRDARLFFNIVPKTGCFRFPPGSVFCFRPAFAGGPASEGADRAKIKNCCISWYVIFCKISSFSASSLAASLSIYSPMRRKVQREIQFSHRSARLSLPIAKAKVFTIHRIKLDKTFHAAQHLLFSYSVRYPLLRNSSSIKSRISSLSASTV